MIVTVTERQIYKRCRKMWTYSSFNRAAMTPIIVRPALQLGRLVHQAHADWIIRPDEALVDLFMARAQQDIDAVQRTYRAAVGAAPSDEELGTVYETIHLGMNMMKNYQAHWGSPLPKGYRIISPEQTVVVPIPGTPHFLEGTLDGLIQNERTGGLCVLERKTYGQRPRLETLQTADQFLAYLWILTQLRIAEIDGIAYDGMWKRDKPPKNGPLDDLFLRVLLHRTEEELTQFGEHLALEVTEMANNPPIYLNRKWEGCNDCDFLKLCIAESRGEDSDYIRDTFFARRQKSENHAEQGTLSAVEE